MFSNKNFVASVFMVTASSMGAGFLALPMVAAGPNFIFSVCMLVIMAIFSYFIAIYSLEIYIVYKNGVNALSVAKTSFGTGGAILSGIINCMYSYMLLMVYIIGGGDLFQKTIFPILKIRGDNLLGMAIFLVIFLPFFLFGYKIVAKSNQYIFSVKLLCFLITAAIGIYYLSSRILEFNITQIKYITTAIPVYFGALAFQTVVPIIARINHYNRAECKKIFAIGIIIPVILYALWIAILLSLVPRAGGDGYHTFQSLLSNDNSIGEMIACAVNDAVHVPWVMKLGIGAFSNIAIITVFLVSGIASYEYWRDAFKIRQNFLGRILTLGITMIIPIIAAFTFPEGFVIMYKQVIILTLLSYMFPLLACFKEYNKLELKLSKLSLFLLIGICICIIIIQILDNFKLFPVFPFN